MKKVFLIVTMFLVSSVFCLENNPIKKNVSWENAIQLCEELSQKVKKSAYHPDVLIGVSRGGLIPVRILSDVLENHNVWTVRIAFYEQIGKTAKEPKIIQTISERFDGKKVLIVDDIVDSGKSLQVAIEYLKTLGAQEIKTAVLQYKKRSCVYPDFFVKEEKDWIVYPWEMHEK